MAEPSENRVTRTHFRKNMRALLAGVTGPRVLVVGEHVVVERRTFEAMRQGLGSALETIAILGDEKLVARIKAHEQPSGYGTTTLDDSVRTGVLLSVEDAFDAE